jgi:peptidoglycan hydrolase-like protein with peptidoglycan-binding domain
VALVLRGLLGLLALFIVQGGVVAAQTYTAPADYHLLDGARSGRYLRLGSAGPEVLALQHALNAVQVPAPETSSFGQTTWAAVRTFQSREGTSADGIVGPQTVAAFDRLFVAVSPAVDDVFEPNDLPAEAAPIGSGAYPDLECFDDDWYRVTLPAKGALRVAIAFQHAAGDLDLALQTASGAQLNQSVSTTDAEVVSRPDLASGDYLVRVYGYRGAEGSYDLDVSVTIAGGSTPAGMPPRPPGALSGSAFIASTFGLSRPDREVLIERELASGNLPAFLRNFQRVTFTATDQALRPHQVTIEVSPDVLAVGTDQDFCRMPMGSRTAQRLADRFGCSLPTRKLSNEIWRAAGVKLTPIPLPPGAWMLSSSYFLLHQQKIEQQRAGQPLGVLTAGHKKDVVLSNRLQAFPERVAIYGWHWPSGQPIQPLSAVHHHTYADYSHGVRLLRTTIVIDGQPAEITDVLRDAVLHPLLSDEGVMPAPWIPGA